MDTRAVQQGLSDAADVITGLQCFPALPDAIDPPTFGCTELEFSYDMTFRGGGDGLVEALYTVGLFVSRGDTDEGRNLLVEYLAPSGTKSIKAALETDRTLGGAAKVLQVERVRGAYRLYQIGGTDNLGALIDVRVWA